MASSTSHRTIRHRSRCRDGHPSPGSGALGEGGQRFEHQRPIFRPGMGGGRSTGRSLGPVPPFVRPPTAPPAGRAPPRRKRVVGVAPGIPARPEPSGCRDRPADGEDEVHAEDPGSGRQSAREQRHRHEEPGAGPSAGTARWSGLPPARGPSAFDHAPMLTDGRSRGPTRARTAARFASHAASRFDMHSERG